MINPLGRRAKEYSQGSVMGVQISGEGVWDEGALSSDVGMVKLFWEW